MSYNFFKNNGPFQINNLLRSSNIINFDNHSHKEISDVKDLFTAKSNNITFFHSKKYESLASKTKASFCITTKNLSHILPVTCKTIIVDNVL